MAPITEAELRTGLKAWLAPRLGLPSVRLVEEFNVEHGAARIDVALIADQLEAFEIKSDLDTLARIGSQLHIYNRVFGRLWILTGPRYSEAAMRIVPAWWGILSAERKIGSEIELSELRPAVDNPTQEPASLAMLLWKAEALALIAAVGLGPVSNRETRSQLSARIAGEVEMVSLRVLVADAIRRRESVIPDLL